MKIKLKGDLDSELIAIGLKPGDIVEANPTKGSNPSAMYFDRFYRGTQYNCVVWPANYEIEPLVK